jgi:macrocin-O-methyltransferase TylF-like protien
MGPLARLLGSDARRNAEFADAAAMRREIARLRGMYLQLLKDCLIGAVYRDPGTNPYTENMERRYDPQWRENGLDWPATAQSMIGNRRMLQLWQACEDVIVRQVPGDFIETGAWRGGACIFMRGLLKTYGVVDRTVWVADSFRGLPAPDARAYPADGGSPFHTVPELAVPVETVRDNFRGYGMLDGQVRFLEGWFKDTLPAAPIERLAVLRLDGDMYESTMDALRALYDKVSPGGYVIVDDYSVPNCYKAVQDFRAANGIVEPVQHIDDDAAFWIKGAR